MSTRLFFPPVAYVPKLFLEAPISLRKLCELAKVSCKASGAWTERRIEIAIGNSLKIVSEPGDWGAVRIELQEMSPQAQAREALAVLAYGMHDLVAKQSIIGEDWNRLGLPRGRQRSGRALTGAERQKRFRESRDSSGI